MAISTTTGGTSTRPGRPSATAAISKRDDSDASDEELSQASYVSEDDEEKAERPERPGKKEEEIQDGPGANWEVAYVYAYLSNFTDITKADGSLAEFPSVMAFEEALLECSPAPPAPITDGSKETRSKVTKSLSSLPPPSAKQQNGNGNGNGATTKKPKAALKKKERAASPASSLSSLSASEAGTAADPGFNDPFEAVAASAPVLRASVEPIDVVPPPRPAFTEGSSEPPQSELVKNVCLKLIETLSQLKELTDYHGKKTWFHFMINFVTARLGSDQFAGGFRWQSNLMRTRGLKPGQENERMFWSMRWEDKIHLLRQMVDFILIGVPKVRDQIKDTYDLGNQRVAHRDPSSNPLVIVPIGRTSSLLTIYQLDHSPRLYASGSPYKASSPWVVISSTLEGYKGFYESLAEPTKADKKKITLKGPFAKAAFGVPSSGATSKKGKGKQEEFDDKEEERVLRARLEERLEAVEEWDDFQVEHADKAARAAARAAERDARIARNLERLNTGLATTRSTRLRTRGGNRDVNYEEEDSPRKRRRVGDEEYEFDDESETASGRGTAGGGGRRSGRGSAAASAAGASAAPRIPGERRSNRIALKEEGDEAEEAGSRVGDSTAVSLNGDAEEKDDAAAENAAEDAVEANGNGAAVETNGNGGGAAMDVDSAIAVFEAAIDAEKEQDAEEQ